MVEIAWTDVILDGGRFVLGETQSHLLKPKHKISPGALATHQITEEMVKDAPEIGEIKPSPTVGADIFVAHSAAFDRQFFPAREHPWICTQMAARRVWPEAPSYSNQNLRNWLNLEFPDPERTLPPHRAGPDTYVTAHILLRLLQERTIEQLIEWTSTPSQRSIG